ncbi:MAG: sigma-70 family RNA polymerase sigma factor [Planctomycetes bacterium]|nr:sigma-70 family RNA polymerase sigma factor [Planctomycetota bacterium]
MPEHSDLDERALVSRARAGDEDAFASLVRMHQGRLRAMLARYLASEDVYDVVQEGFIDAYRNLGTFDPEREFGPWLRTICRNRMVSFLRQRRRQRPLSLVDEAIAERATDPAADAHADELSALRTCLQSLQESHRVLVDLRYGQSVPVKDISERFGKSETSVSMMLMRIREALLKCLRRHAPTAGP